MAGGLLGADTAQLVFRRGLGHEVIDARLGGDGRGRQRIVAGDHHCTDAHPAQLGEALAHAALDDVLQFDDAQDFYSLGDHQRCTAASGNVVDARVNVGRVAPA